MFSIKTPLKPHQREAVQWMTTRKGGIIADEFGMGKSLEVIAGVNDFLTKLGGAALVVCTKTLMEHWREQLEMHTDLSADKIHMIERRQSTPHPGAVFVIVTYEKLAYVRRHARRGLIDKAWTTVILDEAHEIRTRNSVITAVILELKAQTRWCVTSTPFCNRHLDIATLCQFLQLSPWHIRDWWNRFRGDQSKIEAWRVACLLKRDKTHINLHVSSTSHARGCTLYCK